MIYVDNATSVKSELLPENVWGDCSSAYGIMHQLEKAFIVADEKLRALFFINPEDTYFITSSWDDIPRAIIRSSGRKKIHVFLTDTTATLCACDEARGAFDVEYIREPQNVENSLLFLQYVHPLTGVILPVEELETAKEKGCLVALDISYALGKVPLEQALAYADYIMVRGEALGVPLGLSCVVAKKAFLERRETRLSQLHVFVQALEKAISQELFFTTEVARLKAIFEEGQEVLFSNRDRAPHISCLLFKKVKNELLLFTLAKRGFFATIGGGPFPLLERMLPCVGVSFLDSMTALSFCFDTNMDEKKVLEAKARLLRACKELQVISEGV